MARWKYTLIFEGRGHGWSESYYRENSSEDFASQYAQLANVAPKRAALLGAETRIKGDRLALVVGNDLAKLKRVSQPRRLNWPGDAGHSADQTNTSLLAMWSTSDKKAKKLSFMGGVWDVVLPAPDVLDPKDDWTTRFNAWVAAAQDANLGWLTSGRTEPATIESYLFDPDTGHTTYTLKAPGLTWPNGVGKPNKVAVEFPLSKSPLDGTQIVIPLSATTAITAKPRPAKPFTIQGILVLFSPVFKTIGTGGGQGALGTIVPQVGVSRKRGRPLLVSPGRRPVRDVW